MSEENFEEFVKNSLKEIFKRLDVIEAKVDDRNNRKTQRELNKSLRRYAMEKTGAINFVATHTTISGVGSENKQSLKNLLKD